MSWHRDVQIRCTVPSPFALTSRTDGDHDGDFMTFHSQEPLEAQLDAERVAQRNRARAADAARLQALGVRRAGTESSDEIGTLLDAVEEFEHAVESHGGDLMVDEGAPGRTTVPDNAEFVLPRRAEHESVGDFVTRVISAPHHLRQLRLR